MNREQLQREILDQALDARPGAAVLGAWVEKGLVDAATFEAAAARLVELHLVSRHEGGAFRLTVPHGENVAKLLRAKPSIGFEDLEALGTLSTMSPSQRRALQKIVDVLMKGGDGAGTALEVCRWLGLDLAT